MIKVYIIANGNMNDRLKAEITWANKVGGKVNYVLLVLVLGALATTVLFVLASIGLDTLSAIVLLALLAVATYFMPIQLLTARVPFLVTKDPEVIQLDLQWQKALEGLSGGAALAMHTQRCRMIRDIIWAPNETTRSQKLQTAKMYLRSITE